MEFKTIVNNIVTVVNALSTLIIGLAVVFLLYNLFRYLASSGDANQREDSRKYIVYSLIGLFVMVALWGLVNILVGFIGGNLTIPLFS